MTIAIIYDRSGYSSIDAKIDWCREHIGLGRWVLNEPKWDESGCMWAINVVFGNTLMYFKEEADATLFILKWGTGRAVITNSPDVEETA